MSSLAEQSQAGLNGGENWGTLPLLSGLPQNKPTVMLAFCSVGALRGSSTTGISAQSGGGARGWQLRRGGKVVENIYHSRKV